MSDRDDILKELKDELKEKINSVDSNYSSDIAQVERGYFGWNKIVNKPFINFTLQEDVVEDYLQGGDKLRLMDIMLNGWMNNDGINDYTNIHTLVNDLEYFFQYDFTHMNNTHVGTIRLIEGGISAPYSYFQMDLKIRYQQEL